MTRNNEDAVIAAVNRFEITPSILDTVCRATGMGFAAIARVTETKWIACATRDDIAFGLMPGGELELESTICHEIRQSHEPVVISDVSCDLLYRDHHTPARYGFRSYISYPIVLPDGAFFGTLCAIHPEPLDLSRPEILNTFKLFAELLGFHIATLDALTQARASLDTERTTSGLREHFIAILGHDLRNPLAAVHSGVSLLQRGVTEERAALIFSGIHSSIDRITRLIGDMMDFARGRLGGGLHIETRAVELAPVISQVVAELVSTHPEREVTTRLALRGAVECDPERISQLVSNLLGNALTHGAPDLPVAVEAVMTGRLLRIAVANGGAEIPQAARANLFQPFSSGDPAHSRDHLGLGLFIASEVAKAHGGVLTCLSSPQETRFTFEMPL